MLVAGWDVIDDCIPGQPEEPAPEGNAPRLIARKRLQDLDEDVLRQVLRVRRALDAAGDEAVDRLVVVIEDHSERPGIPALSLDHETLDRSVVDRHNDGAPSLVRFASLGRPPPHGTDPAMSRAP